MEREIVVVNPATEEQVAVIRTCEKKEIGPRAQIARAAQSTWEQTSYEERLSLFRNLKRLIKERYKKFADINSSETAKTFPDAMVDNISAASEIHNMERNGISYLRKKASRHLFLWNKDGRVEYEPFGLVGVISPWNLPLAIPAADVFPAIFSGNAVLWKPSEYTPLSALYLQETMLEAGFPKGLLQVVPGYGETGAAVCGVADYVSFTGSCQTGEKVRAACLARGIPFNLEMGGKAPALVLPDADLDRTAYALAYGAFSNSGQYCKSFERAYFPRAIADELFHRLLRIVNQLVPDKDYGPLVTKFQLEIVKNQVEDAILRGAWVATGGCGVSGRDKGFWYRPTVIYGANHSMAVMKEETFGPVVAIMPYDDIEEAVRLVNDSHLGLNASIFTRNEELFRKLARRIVAGNVVWNDTMINWFIPDMPQCGRRGSTSQSCGLERHGASGYERFARPKSVVRHSHPFFHLPLFRHKEPWWLPYDKKTIPALTAFLWAF